MKKIFILVAVGLLGFLSCQEKVKDEVKETATRTKEAVIIHEEYTKPEPTEPSETAYYEPKVPAVGPAINGQAPSDAIILFDGSSLEHWVSNVDDSPAKWHINEDGSMTVANKTGDIRTLEEFGSIQLHVEWKSPLPVQRDNQNRGNSGVFLDGIYEIQILDNNNNDTYVNGQVGSIYKQASPLAMASVPTGEWNAYDIIYHAPEFNDEGGKIKSATVTVLHNGVLVQDHTEIKGTTEFIGWPKNPVHGKGSLVLQDHRDDSRVSFRNIWVRDL